jgi:hypothetical protein
MSKLSSGIVIHPTTTETLQQGRYPALVEALSLRTQNADLASMLFQKPTIVRHEQTMAIVAQHDFPVTFIGAAPALDGTHLFRGQNTDWALINMAQDPLYTQERMPMPERVKRELKGYIRAGMNFEAVFVAHEFEAGRLAPGQPLTIDVIAPPASPGFARRADALSNGAQGMWRALGNAAKGAAGLLAGGVTVAAGVAASAAASAAAYTATSAATSAAASAAFVSTTAGYDPILFGLHVDRSVIVNGRPLALWYYLTHWDW